jgi:hypothetical protein
VLVVPAALRCRSTQSRFRPPLSPATLGIGSNDAPRKGTSRLWWTGLVRWTSHLVTSQGLDHCRECALPAGARELDRSWHRHCPGSCAAPFSMGCGRLGTTLLARRYSTRPAFSDATVAFAVSVCDYSPSRKALNSRSARCVWSTRARTGQDRPSIMPKPPHVGEARVTSRTRSMYAGARASVLNEESRGRYLAFCGDAQEMLVSSFKNNRCPTRVAVVEARHPPVCFSAFESNNQTQRYPRLRN